MGSKVKDFNWLATKMVNDYLIIDIIHYSFNLTSYLNTIYPNFISLHLKNLIKMVVSLDQMELLVLAFNPSSMASKPVVHPFPFDRFTKDWTFMAILLMGILQAFTYPCVAKIIVALLVLAQGYPLDHLCLIIQDIIGMPFACI